MSCITKTLVLDFSKADAADLASKGREAALEAELKGNCFFGADAWDDTGGWGWGGVGVGVGDVVIFTCLMNSLMLDGLGEDRCDDVLVSLGLSLDHT